MKKLFLVLSLLLFSSQACSLSFNVNKAALVKGETLEIEGYCDQHAIDLRISSDGRQVFFEEVLCAAGRFFFNHPISFIDPSGIWDINVSGLVRRVKVSPSRESQFLVLKFLSPGKVIERTQDFNLTVAVTDAGEPVLDAEVVAWQPDGQKVRLAHRGKGIYSLAAEMPVNAKLGLWNLTVAAEKRLPSLAGGEAALGVSVNQASIEMEIFEPKLSTYDLGDSIPLKVKAGYASGKPLQGALASVAVKGQTFALAEANGFFEGAYLPREQDTGSLEFAVSIVDEAGNKSEKIKNVVVVKGLLWHAKTTVPLAVVILIVLAAIVFLSRRMLVKTRKQSKLQLEKKELLASIKDLQKEYLDGTLSKDVFRQESSRMEKRLKEVKLALKAIKKGKPKRRVKKKLKKK